MTYLCRKKSVKSICIRIEKPWPFVLKILLHIVNGIFCFLYVIRYREPDREKSNRQGYTLLEIKKTKIAKIMR